MSARSGRGLLGRIASVVALCAGVLYGVQLLEDFVRKDPLYGFRDRASRSSDNIAITLPEASFRQYHGPKLRSRARFKSIEVTRDRRILMLNGITDGWTSTDNGQSFEFSAPIGVWNTSTRTFEAKGGVRIVNANLDLQTPELSYAQATGELRLPASIKGRLFSGEVEAVDFRYHLPTQTFGVGPVSWVGQIQADEVGKPKSKWTIKAMGATRPPGDVEIWRNGEATDGEIIVKADKIERNVKTDVIVATGKVQYFGIDANLLCQKATVYRREKRAVLEGDVSMLIKPEDQQRLEVVEIQPLRPIVPESIASGRPPAPTTDDQKKLDEEVRSAKNRRKYPVSVYAGRIEYWYQKGQRRAAISGSPQARQELPGARWRQVWAFQAFYDGEKETLRLESSKSGRETRVRTSIGDDLTAAWFRISTRDDDDSWEAEGLSGEVVSEDEDLNERSTGSEKAPPTTPRPGVPPLKGPIGKA